MRGFLCFSLFIMAIFYPLRAQQNASAGAGSQVDAPVKEIVIYLDNSSSIVNKEDDRPALKLGSMLQGFLSKEIGFVTQDDTISVVNFGSQILEKTCYNIQARNETQWKSCIDYFMQPREGDSQTDLKAVIDEVATLAKTPTSDSRPRVIILASDLIHDPLNKVLSKNLKTRSEAEDLASELIDEMDQAFNSVLPVSGNPFLEQNPDNFMICLKVPPLVSSKSNSNYKYAANKISDRVMEKFSERCGALTQSFLPTLSVKDFEMQVRRKMTKWLQLSVLELSENNLNAKKPFVTVKVKNPNGFNVTITGIQIAAESDSNPVSFEMENSVTIAGGSEKEITIATENVDSGLLRREFYLFPVQNPSPSVQMKPSRVTNVSWGKMSVLKAEPVLLGLDAPHLTVTLSVRLQGETDDTEYVDLEFTLEQIPTEGIVEPEKYPAVKVIGEVEPPLESRVLLKNGEATQRFRVLFRNPDIKYEQPNTYQIVVRKKGAGTDFVANRSLSIDRRHTVFFYPSWLLLIGCLVLVFLYFLVAKKTALQKGRGLLGDPLFGFAVALQLVVFFLVWLAGASIAGFYVWLYAAFPALLIGLIFFRWSSASGARHILAGRRDGPLEQQVFQAVLVRFFGFLVVILLAWFLLTRAVF